jgi:hypothetical protein
MQDRNVGWAPNDFLFHAEATLLLRAAHGSGGSLAGRKLTVFVDRELCRQSCRIALPLLGPELGNPIVTFVNTLNGERLTMENGNWR